MDEAKEGYGESNNEGFLGEEEDDDYKDFYNDVNFNEGFLQLLRKNDNSGFRNGDVKENKPLLLSSGFMLQLFGSRFLNFKILGVAFIEEAFVYSQDKIYDFEMKLMDIDNEHLGIPEWFVNV
ncbi:proliferating cell nuclear antigen-like [Glycine soja]|uniref:proliferating cell nuclear antigen-like n=1 Tax=Glycine soja TaxID=3848 RepID=UPI00103F466E|nr:proliferating cell nuclear antigen-like [Glycine soja]